MFQYGDLTWESNEPQTPTGVSLKKALRVLGWALLLCDGLGHLIVGTTVALRAH